MKPSSYILPPPKRRAVIPHLSFGPFDCLLLNSVMLRMFYGADEGTQMQATPRCFSATSALQRHMAPALQPTETRNLKPRHKALAVKRSLRCKKCEHTLSKADFNPSYTKFRINLSAICHVPDLHFALPPSALANSADSNDRRRVTPLPLPTLGFGSAPASNELRVKGFSMSKASNVVLIVSNPAHRATTVRLRQLTAEEETAKLADFLAKNGSAFGTGSTFSTVKVCPRAC